MMDNPFEIDCLLDSSTLVVRGCVDDDKIDHFRQGLEFVAAGSADRDLVVDLSGVDYLPSRAIGVLIGATKQGAATGRRIRLVAEEGTVARRVLELCRLEVASPTAPVRPPRQPGAERGDAAPSAVATARSKSDGGGAAFDC